MTYYMWFQIIQNIAIVSICLKKIKFHDVASLAWLSDYLIWVCTHKKTHIL